MNAKESIMNGKAALGIEFGSTRIKAVLVDENCETLAVGGFHWENQLVDGIWTYSLDVDPFRITGMLCSSSKGCKREI